MTANKKNTKKGETAPENESITLLRQSLRGLGRKQSTTKGHVGRAKRFFAFLESITVIPAHEIDLRAVVPLLLESGRQVRTPVTHEEIEAFLSSYTQEMDDPGVRARARNRMLQTLKIQFQNEVMFERLRRNPAKLVRASRIPLRVVGRKYLVRAEAERLLAEAKASDRLSERNYALLMTMINSGVRPQEARNLRPCDLDLEENHMFVTGKRGRRRVVVVPRLRAVLEAYLETDYYQDAGRGRRDAPLFPSSKARKQMTADALRGLVRRLAKAASIPIRVVPYTLRHTFATLAYDDGFPFGLVADMLGHRNLQNTFFYVHTWQERLRSLVQDSAAEAPLQLAMQLFQQGINGCQQWLDLSAVPMLPSYVRTTER